MWNIINVCWMFSNMASVPLTHFLPRPWQERRHPGAAMHTHSMHVYHVDFVRVKYMLNACALRCQLKEDYIYVCMLQTINVMFIVQHLLQVTAETCYLGSTSLISCFLISMYTAAWSSWCLGAVALECANTWQSCGGTESHDAAWSKHCRVKF